MSKETTTIKDFIIEAEAFPYSKEYFDMLKEAGEIQLLGLCLEANDFVTENPDLLTEQVSMIEGLLTEAGAEAGEEVDGKKAPLALPAGKSTELKDTLWKKVANGFMTVLGWIAKPFKAIYAFLVGLWNRLKGWNESRKVINDEVDRLSKIDATEENKEAVKEVAEKILALKDDNNESEVKIVFKDADAKKMLKELQRLGVDEATLVRANKLAHSSSYNPRIVVPSFLMDTNQIAGKILGIVTKIKNSLPGKANKDYTKFAIRELATLSKRIDDSFEAKDIVIPAEEMKDLIDALGKFNTDFATAVTEVRDIVATKLSNAPQVSEGVKEGIGSAIRALTEVSAKYNKHTASAIITLRDLVAQRDAKFKILAKLLKSAHTACKSGAKKEDAA